MRNIRGRIEQFNQGRDPELVKLKYQKMKKNPFAFLRGSCHLFFEDWSLNSDLNKAPKTWVCGDLHLENFGSYQGDNQLTYFDINDFDEAILAPCTLDLTRLLTSIFLAFPNSQEARPDPIALNNFLLEAYTTALNDGKARWVERETAKGIVKDLLDQAQKNQREKFLKKRTELEGNKRKLLIIKEKTFSLAKDTKQNIKKVIEEFAQKQEKPKFFEVLDVAGRIAGTGSLGLERYIVLVEGERSPDHNYLLDLKLERNSCLDYLDFPQPHWKTQAERIISIQKRAQAIAPALLNAIKINGSFYVMREYQPHEDKVDLDAINDDPKSLEKLMKTIGQVVAWSQLRSSGRQGSAIADELIEFAQDNQWRKSVIEYAHKYTQQVTADWQEFCAQARS